MLKIIRFALPHSTHFHSLATCLLAHYLHSSPLDLLICYWTGSAERSSRVLQTELHGLAALQWSICQDSLSRPNEARIMYEKLKSHPNAEISKKARQFLFSFQAMEMMKVKDPSLPTKTGYEDYFEAFVDSKANYIGSIEEKNESMLEQVFPYAVFLLCPMLIILFAVARKSF